MKNANNQMVKHQDIQISEIDVSLNSNTRFAQKVLVETFQEIPSQLRSAITERLDSIFAEWQYEHGIYPPRPSGFGRALVTIGFSPEGPPPVSFKKYASEASEGNVSAIKPWECDDEAKNAIDLFCKLLMENYDPLMKYLGDEKSPRFDYIFAVAITMALQSNLNIDSPVLLRWAYKLIETRMSIQKSLIGQSERLLKKERNRVTARTEQARSKKERTMKKVRDTLNELSQREGGLPKSYQKIIAGHLGIKQPHVSRLLRDIKKEDQEAVCFIN